jgi:hypothetical protein
MAVRRREATPADIALLLICLGVSAWPLVEGTLNLGPYAGIAVIGAATGFGIGTLVRFQPKLWILLLVAAALPAVVLNAAIPGRPEWTYVWSFIATGVLAGRLFVPPDEGRST